MSDKESTSLVPRPAGELARIPPGASAIIDGMVNDATEIMRARNALRYKVGRYEFREPDYRQILIWAKAVGMTPEELVVRLQERGKEFVVSDGAIIKFQWNFRATGLDLSQVPRLECLYCRDNRLTELDLPRVSHLEELDCWGNQRTSPAWRREDSMSAATPMSAFTNAMIKSRRFLAAEPIARQWEG